MREASSCLFIASDFICEIFFLYRCIKITSLLKAKVEIITEYLFAYLILCIFISRKH